MSVDDRGRRKTPVTQGGGDMLLTTVEVMHLLRLTSTRQVYKLNEKGAIPIKKLGKHNRYRHSDVEKYVESCDTRTKDNKGRRQVAPEPIEGKPPLWPQSLWPIPPEVLAKIAKDAALDEEQDDESVA